MESAPAGPVVPGAITSSSSAGVSPVAPLQTASPFPKPVAAKSPDTNYFARPNGDQPEEVAPPVKKGPSPGTAFLQRYATPNEIVEKATALDGVEGALIALPDGLMVASSIPENMNAETIAGFLPQIFNRVSQCTKELRMGELNNLNFTVGNVPWKIFKVGAIFFAAFGRPGEPMSTAQLAGIAADLDRKAK
jgi:predicted regulator of Ras-like GTPase activity (Roadblock/LC7/MglB family)